MAEFMISSIHVNGDDITWHFNVMYIKIHKHKACAALYLLTVNIHPDFAFYVYRISFRTFKCWQVADYKEFIPTTPRAVDGFSGFRKLDVVASQWCDVIYVLKSRLMAFPLQEIKRNHKKK